jgi:hypothetical protein
MCSSRLNLPMICSAAADEDGEAPERRGVYGRADQRGPAGSGATFSYQRRWGYSVAVSVVHMDWCSFEATTRAGMGGRGYEWANAGTQAVDEPG